MVAFKYKQTIPKYLGLRKSTPKILNILNCLLVSYFLIHFDETENRRPAIYFIVFAHFLPKLLITIFLRDVKIYADQLSCLYTQWILCNFLHRCQSGLTHHFAWVSPLVNFKERLFSNKHKEVISNNRTNIGTSERKLCSHVGETLFFIPMLFSRFPQEVGEPTCA